MTLPRPFWQVSLRKLRLVIFHISRGFSVIVAPHTTGTTVTFNIPGRVGTVILILVITIIIGAAFIGVTYTRIALLALETTRLRAENDILRNENEKIREIEYELALIDKARREIETWAGIVPEKAAGAQPGAEPLMMASTWPRRYSYGIMKPVFAGPYNHSRMMTVPAIGWISRRYIEEKASIAGHPGIDIAASRGTPVRSALDGRVRFVGWDDIYGNLIIIDHSDSLSTAYGHNEKMLVKEGDHVSKGQVIATIGSTGRSTAPHLHFEILESGLPVDPELYLDFPGG
jgi:murein DD-endopeptidase MepM/ murein hydrolase activator NlpD